MKRNGKGGANTNKNGLDFEKTADLVTTLKEAGYRVEDAGMTRGVQRVWSVYDGDALVGFTAQKNAFLTFIKKRFGVKVDDVLSKSLLPDEAFYNISDGRFDIVEKKSQNTSGSVDEKLETGVAKLWKWNKVAKACGLKGASYGYVLSDWFRQSSYEDDIEFNAMHGIPCVFNHIDLSMVGLPTAGVGLVAEAA